jgi:hypothetical protein
VCHWPPAVNRQLPRVVGIRIEDIGSGIEVIDGAPDLIDRLGDARCVLGGVVLPSLPHECCKPGVVVPDLGFRDGAHVHVDAHGDESSQFGGPPVRPNGENLLDGTDGAMPVS